MTRFSTITGKGLRATVDGRQVLVGNARLLSDAGLDTTPAQEVADRYAAEGKTPILAAVERPTRRRSRGRRHHKARLGAGPGGAAPNGACPQ